MRSPARNIAGHVMWTRTGSVWAVWRLHPLPYGYRNTKEKNEVRQAHQMLYRNLLGESLHLGVTATLDPAAIVERMIEGVDLSAHPDWALECEATLDTLDQIGIGQRTFWLAKPLVDKATPSAMAEAGRSAFAELCDSIGLPRPGVSAAEVERRLAQAAKIQATIPAIFHPEPATAAQLVWLHAHSQQRGLFMDSTLPENQTSEELMGRIPRSGACLVEPLLDEGGQSDLESKDLRTWRPLERRYLKVSPSGQPGQAVPSYQALTVLTDVPAGGMVFPGSEFLGRIDEWEIDVDWAQRVVVRSSDKVAKANKRALKNLNEQFDQRSDEMTTGLNALEMAGRDLAEYNQILDSDKNEVEVQSTTIFATAAATADGANDRARALADAFANAGYKLSQPLGEQENLWWAMQIGVPATRVVNDFAQITTSKAISTAVAFASTELGDNQGAAFAVNISSGIPGIVLHDIAGAATIRGVSGSMAIAGELGSGKSVAMKTLAGGVVDRGGQVVAVDRTVMGEWAFWASSVADSTVVDVANPAVSLDPLRMYGPGTGGRIAQSFFTTLLNVAPMSNEGIVLSAVLDPAYLAEHNLVGIGDVLTHLDAADVAHSDALASARETLAGKMKVIASKDFGRVIFDTSLPPLKPTAPVIVIRTHTLALPTHAELSTSHLFAQMSVEKIFGRALYALIGGLAREICFVDRTRLGCFLVDECHHMTSSPEGELFIVDFVRDGRKHKAAVILGSHDPEADFGSETLRGLMPTRVQLRQTDRTLARRGLKWLDMDPDNDEMLELLTKGTSPAGPNGVDPNRRGEGFMRDAAANIGRIKVLAPSRQERREAVMTTPPEPVAAAEEG